MCKLYVLLNGNLLSIFSTQLLFWFFLSKSPLILVILLLPVFAPKWVYGFIATNNIAKMVKDTVSHLSSTDVTKMMKSHLMQMQLINMEENWAHPNLKSIEDFLFPQNLTGQYSTKVKELFLQKILIESIY